MTTELPTLRLGARTSPLARAQIDLVLALVAEVGLHGEFVGITTAGDVDQRALTVIGGTGIFAGAVRDALLRGDVDLAVHSLKDLPTAPEPGLEIIAIPPREDTRDVLVGRRLADLADGDRVGTGAPRRAVQLQDWAARAGLMIEIVPIRGNVDTRIAKARTGEVDAVLLAAAGLARLGHLDLPLSDRPAANPEEPAGGEPAAELRVQGLPAEVLSHVDMLPAPGQGALALEVRSALAPELKVRLQQLDDAGSRAEVLAERGFLAALEAGCTAPVGARAVVKSVRGRSLDLTLTAVIGRTLVSNLSGPTTRAPLLRISVAGSTEDPYGFGAAQAGKVLAELS